MQNPKSSPKKLQKFGIHYICRIYQSVEIVHWICNPTNFFNRSANSQIYSPHWTAVYWSGIFVLGEKNWKDFCTSPEYYICYLLAGRSVLGETVPEVLRPWLYSRQRTQFFPTQTDWITFFFFCKKTRTRFWNNHATNLPWFVGKIEKFCPLPELIW